MCENCKAYLKTVPEDLLKQVQDNYETNRDTITGYKPDALHELLGLSVEESLEGEKRKEAEDNLAGILNALSFIHDIGAALAYVANDKTVYEAASAVLMAGLKVGDALRGTEEADAVEGGPVEPSESECETCKV